MGENMGSAMLVSKLSDPGSKAASTHFCISRNPSSGLAEIESLLDCVILLLCFSLASLCLRFAKLVLVMWALICLASLGPRPGALLTLRKVNGGAIV